MKTCLLHILAFMLLSGIGFGQEPLWQNDSTLIYEFNGASDSMPKQRKLYTQDFNLRKFETIDFYFDDGWQPSRKTVELQNEDGNSLVIRGYIYDDELQDFRNNWKNEFVYDTSGKVSERSSYSWDVANAIWKYSSKYEYIYNNHGNKILQLQYKGSGSNWIKKEKDSLIYDENQIILERISHQWQPVLQYWEKESRLLYFNTGNVNDSLYEYLALNEEWVLGEKTIYHYDSGLLTGSHSYGYEDESWVNLLMANYEYDQNNFVTLTEQYGWYADLQQWQGLYKYTYVYNFNNMLSKSYSYTWDENLNDWMNSRKSSFVYDANMLNILKVDYDWLISEEQWEISEKVFNYFTDVASIGENRDMTKLAEVYPTITNGNLNIVVNETIPKLSLSLFTVNGNLVKHQTLSSGLNDVSIERLDSGVYILVLFSKNQFQHNKIILR